MLITFDLEKRKEDSIIKWVDERPVFIITTHPPHNANLLPMITI